jgi:integrase
MARGSIIERRRKDGSTAYAIKYRTADGAQVFKTIGPSRRQADRALTAALAAVDRGDLRTVSRETFADHSGRWLAAKRPRVEQSTYDDYERHLRLRLNPAFGSLRLQQITRSRIEEYLSHLDSSGELSRKSINDSLIPLRQILGRAAREGIVASNAALSAERDRPLQLRYEPPPMRHLSAAEARSYLSACMPWYRPLAEVLVGAGLRIGEALALEWQDFDLDNLAIAVERTIKRGGIGTPKGDRRRVVMIDPELGRVLREHRITSQRVSGLVFASRAGTMLNRDNVRRRGHQTALRSARLPPNIRLHDLRHTAASLWLAAGESIYFVKEQLGHADIQTTINLYGHPDQAAHREAAARAAAWWRTA